MNSINLDNPHSISTPSEVARQGERIYKLGIVALSVAAIILIGALA